MVAPGDRQRWGHLQVATPGLAIARPRYSLRHRPLPPTNLKGAGSP
jgi:hypothetical protein